MNDMFRSCPFNQDISTKTVNAGQPNEYVAWDVSKVTTLFRMFQGSPINQNIGNWDVSSVTNMSAMFISSSFNNGGNPSISGWNVSNVVNMSQVFRNASSFNQPIGGWNTSNVTDMSFLFNGAGSFSQYIGDWNTSKVTTMLLMFEFAHSFNQNISTKIVNSGQENQYTAWDVSNVTNMGRMLRGRNFNQPIGNWDMSKVTNIGGMFWDASSFNQPIKDWNITGVTSAGNFMTTNGFSTANYDDVLNTWSQKNVKSGLTINFASIKYSSAGVAGRATLVNTYGWTITDGGQV
jgi:surface protein